MNVVTQGGPFASAEEAPGAQPRAPRGGGLRKEGTELEGIWEACPTPTILFSEPQSASCATGSRILSLPLPQQRQMETEEVYGGGVEHPGLQTPDTT